MRARGFTLIELMIIIAIVAILIALIIPALTATKPGDKGFVCDRACKANKLTCTSEQMVAVNDEFKMCSVISLSPRECMVEAKMKHCSDNRY
jgi:prepilin-type N-terminal cleavage/methylation domain-containing protein